MQNHTAASIKSLEGFRIAWVDEAQNLSARSLALLRPTIRARNSELWASWNPFNIPIGAGLDFWGTSTPNSSFAFPTGQAISRATYAALFAIMGTTYGVGDGSTTFNLPDKTGRVSAMKEATPTRLTALGFGIGGSISSNMGATGGIDNEALVLGNLPTGITVAGAISVTSTVGGIPYNVPGENSFSGVGTPAWSGGTDGSISSTGTANLVSNNTGSQATGGARNVPICQPTIISNYIIRII
jgi:microcystin-dependent protein